MTTMYDYAPGSFCWADLATTDAASSKRFYCDLFGWQAVDMPTGGGPDYTMLQKNSQWVCALYEMSAEMRQHQPQAAWASFIRVDELGAVAEAVVRLGGQLIDSPMDVLDAGRMAVARDPTGAVFMLWEPKRHRGAQLRNEPSTLCWHELMTPDVPKARDFYSQLLGWRWRETRSATSEPYHEILCGDDAIGGMMQIQKSWGDVPPHWSVYFSVENCERSIAEAERLGGGILMGLTEIPGTGRFAMVRDPQGAHFSIIELGVK